MIPVGWIVRVWCGVEEADDPPYDTALYIAGFIDPSDAVAVKKARGKEGERAEALEGPIVPGIWAAAETR